ncbi:MAG TPA: PAS domain S-box protein, partial [Candidatus Limnocylindrales bacterium]|nr:PAS domain S-box protein [Candidatus Limnocylindrales bacterium]
MPDEPRPRSDGSDETAPAGHLAVLDAAPNAIVAVDTRGRIVYANPQVSRTFGWTVAELLGQPVEVLLPDRVAADHIARRDGFVAHPDARPMGIGLELSGRRRDGTEFPVEIGLSPLETP